jgi:hypothetical protein
MLDIFVQEALPQGDQEYSVLSLMGEGAAVQRSPEFNKKLAGELASGRALLNPDKSYFELYEAALPEVEQSQDPRQSFTPLVEAYKTRNTDRITNDAITRMRSGEPMDVVLAHARTLKSLFDSSNSVNTDTIVRGLQSSSSDELYKSMLQASNALPYSMISEQVAKEGRTDFNAEDVQDWASLFLVPDNVLNDSDVIATVNRTGILKVKDMAELGQLYQRLPPMDREDLWAAVFPAMWEEYDGNIPKVNAAVSRIQAYDPAFAQSMNYGFDALTLAGLIPGAMLTNGAKALIGARKLSSIAAKRTENGIAALRDGGSKSVAADAALQRATNLGDAALAGKNASPYNFENTVLDSSEVVDGLAPEIAARIAEGADSLKTLDDVLAATKKASLNAKAAELDLWAADAVQGAGGRTVDDITAEMAQVQKLRDETWASMQRSKASTGSNRPTEAFRLSEEKLLDYDKQLARLQKAADAPEAAKLARQYASKMRLGHVPEEFADDIAEHQNQVMRDWDNAVTVANPRNAERAAQEAEVAKMREELQLDLQSVRELGREEMIALKLRAAKVNKELGAAKAAGDAEKTKALTAEAAEIKAAFEEHSFALSTRDNLAKLETRDFGKGGRARLKAAVDAVRAKASSGTAQQAGTKAANMNKFSADDAANAAVTEGVSDVTSAIAGFQSGDAFLDVARAAFARSVSDKERAAFASSKRNVRNIETVSTSDQNIVLKYTLDDGVETRTYSWNQDALGNWDVSEMTGGVSSIIKAMATNILSPTTNFKTLSQELVSNFTLGGMQSAAIYHNLIKLAKSIEKTTKLTKEQAVRVENLLRTGDELGEVYDAKVMITSNSVLNRQWDAEEVIAYFKWRQLYDGLADVQNSAVHRLLAFQGYKEVHITGLADDVTQVAARALRNDEITRFGTGKNPTEVYVLSDDMLEVKALRAEDIGTYEKLGYKLMSIYGDKLATKELQHIMVKEGARVVSKPLRKQVLHKVTGYIPRIYERGMYFVKDVRSFKTIGAFDGKKEATAWVQSQNKGKQWEVFADAELPPEMVQHDNIQGMGGLWYQSRRGEVVQNPATKEKLARLDLGQSTQQYLTTVSELLPLNEYRASVMAQFADAVRAVAQKNGKGQGFIDPTDIVNSEIRTGDKAADLVLHGTRQYLQQQLGARTTAESFMSSWMGALVDYMEGGAILGGKLRRGAQYLRVQDPVARIKAGVFHAYLGCFNMAQVAVQMNNAVISSSVYPQHALGAFYDSLKMRAVLLLDKEAVETLSARAKIDLLEAHDELYKLGWGGAESGTAKKISARGEAIAHAAAAKRSGYLDSIFRQGDYRTQVSGFGGVTMEATRKALHTGALPFAEGELFARLMAFNIAKREFLKRNPGTKSLDDLAIHAIVQDSLRINMNLQKENAAVWQSNWVTAIPTQFLQVQAKFAENVVGGMYGGVKDTIKGVKHTGARHTGLSGAEATRVAIGQVAVYGMVGVPAGAWMLDWVAKNMGYETPEGNPDTQRFMAENPETVALYSEGVLGKWLDMWGANINVNERFSLLAGLDDNVLTAMADAVIQTATGNTAGVRLADMAPAVGVGVRITNTLDTLAQRVGTMVTFPESSPQEMFLAITDVATVASSFNNLEKLHLYRVLGYEYSKSARATVAWKDEEMNYSTQLAKALGFSTDSEFDTWYMSGELKELQDTENTAAKFVRQAYLAQAEGNQKRHDYLLQSAEAVLGNPLQFEELRSREFKKMLQGETMEDSNRLKLWKEYMKGAPVQSNLTRESN